MKDYISVELNYILLNSIDPPCRFNTNNHLMDLWHIKIRMESLLASNQYSDQFLRMQ